MNKIIITGGSGFIGSNLVNYFLKKKYFVINIDKLAYSGNNYNLKNINKKNYVFLKSDINNRSAIIKALKKYKPSSVFNLAAETHVDRSIDNPAPFIHSNINGVFNLLEAIRFCNQNLKKKIKLIHVSTDEVYGDIVDKSKRADEAYSYKPSSPYAASKASADHLVKSYIRTYNFPQSRLTDHRIGLTIHSLTQVMEGELDEVIETLQSEDQKLKLEALINAQLGA